MSNKFLEWAEECNVLVTHDSCADGLGSALLVKDCLPNIERIDFVQYGHESYKSMKPLAGERYLFVDMTPPPSAASLFVEAGALVLDHHIQARDLVERFGERGIFAHEASEPGVSGTVLAYDHLWKPKRCGEVSPKFAEFVSRFSELSGVYDTWQRKRPEWDEALTLVRTMHFAPSSFWLARGLASMADSWDEQFGWIGDVLVEKGKKTTKKLLDGAEFFTTAKGTNVALVNSRSVNEVSDMLAGKSQIVVGYSYEMQGGQFIMACSLRSPGGYDCGALAKRYGGGGHTGAAGMSLKTNRPAREIFELVLNENELGGVVQWLLG